MLHKPIFFLSKKVKKGLREPVPLKIPLLIFKKRLKTSYTYLEEVTRMAEEAKEKAEQLRRINKRMRRNFIYNGLSLASMFGFYAVSRYANDKAIEFASLTGSTVSAGFMFYYWLRNLFELNNGGKIMRK